MGPQAMSSTLRKPKVHQQCRSVIQAVLTGGRLMKWAQRQTQILSYPVSLDSPQINWCVLHSQRILLATSKVRLTLDGAQAHQIPELRLIQDAVQAHLAS